ncbi:Periplasmic aromatic aldehyde oxidoreductase, iron-sulfur subunit YagT [Serinicoccus hydrothermalis]|uniref:Periplasmic aromatic aldehyde oxidoreductase, iron-sulfur subunit YagT n=1 Tax=Serinicoccus hydrothermalis TaxID=1758689 RepID=A0A1B1NDD1_9MICO|nr:2Fe-2S iron-sulfur cluster-binding protein [Serinicoccus hydrothermalis]ANS79426.1 Periplasmic aromatic aldehyde oxidoreductase, iron-sulfur subunit YagT [Serinicoccus hydrothermalis]
MDHDTGGASTLSTKIVVNGTPQELTHDVRMTLLDALRDHLGVTSAKKGCDHGQCGACTVLVDGRRVVSCLSLTASLDGSEVVTAEGLGTPDDLSDLQQAFVDRDGLQCGYCTPGQVCSAQAMLAEVASGMPSHVTDPSALADPDVAVELSDAEIRERMSGNLCRCGAYVNIVAAIRDTAAQRAAAAGSAEERP